MKLLKEALLIAAVILWIFGMTMSAFVDAQHERVSSSPENGEIYLPFDGELTSVTSEQAAANILVCVELIGELFLMLALMSFAMGIVCAVINGIGELFEALLGAIRRLFVLKRQPSDRPDTRRGDDDPGMSWAKIHPRRPSPSLQYVRTFGGAAEDGKAQPQSSRVAAPGCN